MFSLHSRLYNAFISNVQKMYFKNHHDESKCPSNYLLNDVFGGGEGNLDGAFDNRQQQVLYCLLHCRSHTRLELRELLEQRDLQGGMHRCTVCKHRIGKG